MKSETLEKHNKNKLNFFFIAPKFIVYILVLIPKVNQLNYQDNCKFGKGKILLLLDLSLLNLITAH